MKGANNESWKLCVNGKYSISNRGRVRREIAGRNTWKGRTLVPIRNVSGYLRVAIFPPPKRCVFVHKLVAEAFIGHRPHGKQINHVNGNKSDNRVENLEYITPSENMRHALVNGFHPPIHGVHQWRSVLSDAKVKRIRELRKAGKKLNELAEMFGVTFSNISNVCRRVSWKHVE